MALLDWIFNHKILYQPVMSDTLFQELKTPKRLKLATHLQHVADLVLKRPRDSRMLSLWCYRIIPLTQDYEEQVFNGETGLMMLL